MNIPVEELLELLAAGLDEVVWLAEEVVKNVITK